MTDLELRIYAATVAGEAEGEGDEGMAAVAWVIRTRVEMPNWPTGIIPVCFQPFQFSFWNSDSRRRGMMLQHSLDPAYWLVSRICTDVFCNWIFPDPTGGATHYYNPELADPSWAKKLKFTVQIGNHRFHREGA